MKKAEDKEAHKRRAHDIGLPPEPQKRAEEDQKSKEALLEEMLIEFVMGPAPMVGVGAVHVPEALMGPRSQAFAKKRRVPMFEGVHPDLEAVGLDAVEVKMTKRRRYCENDEAVKKGWMAPSDHHRGRREACGNADRGLGDEKKRKKIKPELPAFNHDNGDRERSGAAENPGPEGNARHLAVKGGRIPALYAKGLEADPDIGEHHERHERRDDGLDRDRRFLG